MSSPLRTVVVIDYQNVHLTAHDLFDPYGEERDALIHPGLFAKVALRRRNERQHPGWPPATLSEVLVFRGLPSSEFDWEQNRRCTAQAEQWRKDGVVVGLRELKYEFQMTAQGVPATDINGSKIPIGSGREKGVDVLVALACLRHALRSDVDLVILASRDTDLVPVLDTLCDMRRENHSVARIETVSWFDRRTAAGGVQQGGNLRASGDRRVWDTGLDRECFEASLDRNDYL